MNAAPGPIRRRSATCVSGPSGILPGCCRRAVAPAVLGPPQPGAEPHQQDEVYLVLDGGRYSGYDAHYLPDPGTPVTRVSEPANYRDGDDPPDRTVLCAELPCSRDGALWRAGNDRLAGLVNDLFELSRIHSGALALDMGASNSGGLVDLLSLNKLSDVTRDKVRESLVHHPSGMEHAAYKAVTTALTEV